MSGVSSRVLNMKFMRQALKKEEKKQEIVKQKKAKDASQWSISAKVESFKLKKEAVDDENKPYNTAFQSVGYSNMQDFFEDSDDSDNDSNEDSPALVGRKVFGAAEKSDDDDSIKQDILISETRIKDDSKSNKSSKKTDVKMQLLKELKKQPKQEEDVKPDHLVTQQGVIPSVQNFLNGIDSVSTGEKRKATDQQQQKASKKSKKKKKKNK